MSVVCDCGRIFATEGTRRYHVRSSPACRRWDDDQHGRAIAEQLFAVEEPCEVCGKTGKGRGVIDRHHRDSDRLNNAASNIAFLCRKHHQAAHSVSDGKVGGGPRPRIVALMRDRAMRRYESAVALRHYGWTTRQIAERLDVDPASVTRWFRKYAP